MAEELPLYLYVQRSVALLQAHAPKDRPYDGGFSGGKDSVVIKELAKMAGVNVRWSYTQTTIDPPELVVFLRRAHPDVRWIRPKHGFLLQRAPAPLSDPARLVPRGAHHRRGCVPTTTSRRWPSAGGPCTPAPPNRSGGHDRKRSYHYDARMCGWRPR